MSKMVDSVVVSGKADPLVVSNIGAEVLMFGKGSGAAVVITCVIIGGVVVDCGVVTSWHSQVCCGIVTSTGSSVVKKSRLRYKIHNLVTDTYSY